MKRSESQESLAKYDSDIRKDAVAAVAENLQKLLPIVPPEHRDVRGKTDRSARVHGRTRASFITSMRSAARAIPNASHARIPWHHPDSLPGSLTPPPLDRPVALDRLIVLDRPDAQVAGENFRNYNALFERYISEVGTTIDWDAIKPPRPGMIQPHHELPEVSDDPVLAKELLSQLAVLKLNGGLGTSMGCVGPKSAIAVRRDLTFLDLVVRQIESLNDTHDVDVPLVLMNSFNTHEDTEDILRKYVGKKLEIKTFNQSRFPLILKDTLTPLPRTYGNKAEWYPPGHGDLYRSLQRSGTLDNLLEQGKKWLFVSNIDNLGATVDLKILQYVLKTNPDCEFIMEVTDKTRADIKGGTLVEQEGVIRLLEVAQVPKEHVRRTGPRGHEWRALQHPLKLRNRPPAL